MKPKRIAPLVSVLLLAVVGLTLAPPAAAKGPRVRNGVVQACMKTKGKKGQIGTIRIVNSPRQCKKRKGEKPLTWSLLGPAAATDPQPGASAGGEAGAKGDGGDRGPQGTQGPQGATGPQGEKGAAATVESQLRETIADQGREIEVLLGKVGSLTTEVHQLETDLGNAVDQSVEAVKDEVGALRSNVVEPLVGQVGLLAPLPGELNTLGNEVAEQCTSLSEVVTEANGTNTVLGEVIGRVGLLLGLGTPAPTEPVTC
ncbi:MAG TPA: hypothetical protein VHA76_09050 [Solirubrobacterales bacterium]|nr:hypothetical protein [Solirubrobacterales bacterium]